MTANDTNPICTHADFIMARMAVAASGLIAANGWVKPVAVRQVTE